MTITAEYLDATAALFLLHYFAYTWLTLCACSESALLTLQAKHAGYEYIYLLLIELILCQSLKQVDNFYGAGGR